MNAQYRVAAVVRLLVSPLELVNLISDACNLVLFSDSFLTNFA